MKQLLVDLGRHQSWADAECWRALEQCPAAMEDKAIRLRLHHLHFVQRAFLWLVEGKDPSAFQMSTPQDFPSFGALKEFGQSASRAMGDFIDAVADERLGEPIHVPWFKRDTPVSITVAEALTQAVMHSQWHRGQNATRLRELGGEPPTVDLILWYIKDRPPAAWDKPA